MKKFKSLFLVLFALLTGVSMAFGLTACGDKPEDTPPPASPAKAYTTTTQTITSGGKNLGFRINMPNDAEGKVPVIIFCVGKEQVLTSMYAFADYYSSKGYATVQFDYTNTGYPKTTSEGTLAELTISTMTGNVDDVWNYLDADGRFDMENAVVCGYSLGGLVASVYASEHPEKVARLIAFAPAYDMYYYAHGTDMDWDGVEEPTPSWGDPYAEGATDFTDASGVTMCLQYIRECWDLDYDNIFDTENGYGGPLMYCVGTADTAMTYGTWVLQRYMVDETAGLTEDAEFVREDVNIYIIPNATHNMISMQTQDLLDRMDDFLGKYPVK